MLAAARSLRGVESPHPEIANYLVKAIYNIWEHDNPISFDSYQIEWPLKNFTTALTEIFETLAHFGIFARPVLSDLEHLLQHCAHKFDMHVQVKLSKAIGAIKEDQREIESGCCKDFVLFDEQEESSEQATPGDVRGDLVLQDQDGSRITWNEFFAHKPTILAFFYTRCSNPRKCTQTIIGLATIQKRLIEIGFNGKVRVAAISYDPKFDSPGALKSYGNARKFIFNDDSCMFRVQEDFDEVIRAFRLGVNFNGSQVNSHRIELFLLGSNGKLDRSFLRLQTDPQKVVDAAISLCKSEGRLSESHGRRKSFMKYKLTDRFQSASTFFLGCLMVVFPKCPMCWVSYMSLLGVAGAEALPFRTWLLPIIISMLSANLYFMFRSARARNGYLPFSLSLTGSIFLLLATIQIAGIWANCLGLGLLLAGSLLQSLSYSKFNKLMLFFQELQFRLERFFRFKITNRIAEFESQPIEFETDDQRFSLRVSSMRHRQ